MFSDPDKNIRQFSLAQGWRVADLGAGSGAYTFAAANAVGADGRVYAVDVSADLLSKVSNEARRLHLKGPVDVVRGDLERRGGSGLRDAHIDAVIAANLFFQIEHKRELVREIARILRVGGRVLLVDWSGSFGGIGPHPDHVFPKEEARRLFEEQGFTAQGSIDAGAHHYGLVFKKN